MSLAHRVIPTILSKDGHLVKGEGFKADRICGNALQAAKIHAMRSVDELVILDVGDGEPDYEMIAKLTESSFTPITVGGGVKSIEDVHNLLVVGADKVCIPMAEYTLIEEVSVSFGKQCVMAAIDINGKHYKLAKDHAMDAWATLGAGEILLQSVERDGTMQGYDLDLIREVSSAVSIPVIASGGCSGYNDMYEAIQAGASAVAAGALFLFTEATPRCAAEYLNDKGIEVRCN